MLRLVEINEDNFLDFRALSVAEEVCVRRDDAAALRLYEKLGFADTGYLDPDAPDCLNLRYDLR